MIAAWFVVIEYKLHIDRTCRATGAGFSPSLYCRTNAPGDVHLAIIRGAPSCCAEISGEYQARSYDEPNGEPAHALVPGTISDFESSDPQAWLADLLAHIAAHPVQRLDELLPWNWCTGTLQVDQAA